MNRGSRGSAYLKAAVLVAMGGMACSVESSQEALGVQQAPVMAGKCEVQPPFNPNFEPELEWAWTGNPKVLPDHKQVMMTPVVVDLNGDGVPDVVFNAYVGNEYNVNGVVRAISGADGSDLWTVTDPAYRVRGASSIAAGDIDHDGKPEVCTVPESGNGFICFEHDGTFKFRTAVPANNWGGVSFADLDGDGNVEIIDGNYVFSNTGTLLWVGSDGMGGTPITGPVSFAADIDGDGIQEVINDRAVYRADGSLKCVNTQIGHGLAGVGNFDADDKGEIVVVWSGHVSLLDDNCALLWTALIPGGGEGGAPNIADFDNDGQPEIGVAGAIRYSVFETNGTVKWSSPTQDGSSNRTGSSTFDFEGDGKAEAVYADETFLRIYDGATGAIRFQVPHSSCTTYENPVIVDVDGDNNAEIVTAANVSCGYGPYAGIRVFRDKKDGWVNTRRIWNQHAYSVTNVNEDGTIPSHSVANWRTQGLNTFRSNSQGSGTTSAFAAADLVASEVKSSCDGSAQHLTLSARVTNQGDAAASAGLQVAFFQGNPSSGGTLLGVATLPSVLAAGASANASLTLSPPPGGNAEIFVVADYGSGTGRELECHEDNNIASAQVSLACASCIEVRLNDYNLFVLEDYTLGTDVEGKVAAGGNITMNHFSVGQVLPASDIANTLVAGGNLTLTNGGVWGDAWYGGSYSADGTVVYPRGAVAQGTPIDFAARGTQLRNLSTRLAGLTANGTTTVEPWGGVMLRGTDPSVNVFQVNASDLSHAVLLSIDAPAGSLAVLNISGAAASLQGGHSFSGGIDQHGVLFNFVDATAISAAGYGLWGTMLAPYAQISFSNGSFDGAIYARSMTGNAEGHINPLNNHDICLETPMHVLVARQPTSWPGSAEDLVQVRSYLDALGVSYTAIDIGPQGLTSAQLNGYDAVIFLSFTDRVTNATTLSTLVDFYEQGGGVIVTGDDITWTATGATDQARWEGMTRLHSLANGAIALHTVQIPASGHPVVAGLEGTSFIYPLDIDEKVVLGSGAPAVLATAVHGSTNVGPAISAYQDPSASAGRVVTINMGFYNGIDTTSWNGAPYIGPAIPPAVAQKLLDNSLRWVTRH